MTETTMTTQRADDLPERWSAQRKTEVVLRLVRGEAIDEVAREIQVPVHEVEEWRRVKLPDNKVLLPGVITQSTVLVEHPELVAQRIERFADVVGRERVIASADCGFASFAGSNEVHPSIVWAKFAALVEGARIASQRLWAK